MNALSLLAEFLGTFLLVMSILATGNALVIGGTLGQAIKCHLLVKGSAVT